MRKHVAICNDYVIILVVILFVFLVLTLKKNSISLVFIPGE